MKALFKQSYDNNIPIESELSVFNLSEAIEKTRIALDVAYTGFDNALENEMIDSYIYEINALQKRYEHLTDLAAKADCNESGKSRKHASIRSLVSHVFS